MSAPFAEAWSWKQVLTFRATWLLLLGRLITDPAWYFYQFWFPKYLNVERGLSQTQLKVTWIVYAAAGVGSLLGGWLSGRLIKGGTVPAASRLWIMLGCACLMPVSPLIARVAGIGPTMALTVVAVLAALAWLTNLSAIVVDVVPKHSVGTVFSVVAAGSTLGGIIMNLIVAKWFPAPRRNPQVSSTRPSRAFSAPSWNSSKAKATGNGLSSWRFCIRWPGWCCGGAGCIAWRAAQRRFRRAESGAKTQIFGATSLAVRNQRVIFSSRDS